jgi:hypothetical protein
MEILQGHLESLDAKNKLELNNNLLGMPYV